MYSRIKEDMQMANQSETTMASLTEAELFGGAAEAGILSCPVCRNFFKSEDDECALGCEMPQAA
jgi:hypothetical protein